MESLKLHSFKRQQKFETENLLNEQEIVKNAKSDPSFFGILYDRNYDRIFNYILKRVSNVSLAEDLTSNTFFKALEKIGTFNWEGIPFSAWLYRIATNEIRMHFRKSKILKFFAIDDYKEKIKDDKNCENELIKAEEEWAKNQKFIKVTSEIQKLSIKYQEVIALRYFEDKSIREISGILGKSEGTVKSLIHRGLQKLEKEFN